MKKIFQYMTALLLLLVVGTSCEEGNDNWRIITDTQPGAYITSDATIYSATATSSQPAVAPLGGTPEGASVVGIYTWLKSSGSFTILNVDEEGSEANCGKGDVVASTPAETVTLAVGGTPFTAVEDGSYYVAVDKANSQLTITPAKFGAIGDTTPSQWDGGTAMQVSYNEAQAAVEYSISDVILGKKKMKFRYSGDWGFEFPYQGDKVKLHTNVGYDGDNTSAISEAFSEYKGGEADFQVGKVGVYTITLKPNLHTGRFSTKAICTAEGTSSATLPRKMFVNDNAWGWPWDWSTAPEMIPAHSHDGMFWDVYYLQAGNGMKFNSEKSWSTGGNFRAENEDPKGYGEYPAGGSNLEVAGTGYYLIIISYTLSADKKSVNRKVILAEPKLFLGSACAGGWAGAGAGKPNDLEVAFALAADSATYEAVTAGDGDLHIYMATGVQGVDWWQSKLMARSDKIKYRGKGGDQESRVPVTIGKTVSLDFRTNTGDIQ